MNNQSFKNFIYRIIFIAYLKIRPSKDEYIYFYGSNSTIYKTMLFFIIGFLSYCLWTHKIGLMIISFIGFIIISSISKMINVNEILMYGFVEYINNYFKTDKFKIGNDKYTNCFTYDTNLIILEDGFFNNKNEECVLVVNNSGKLLDKMIYVNQRIKDYTDRTSNSIFNMYKCNILGCNNEDVDRLIINLDKWITIQNPARSILNHMNQGNNNE
jgi:hypothetical protein